MRKARPSRTSEQRCEQVGETAEQHDDERWRACTLRTEHGIGCPPRDGLRSHGLGHRGRKGLARLQPGSHWFLARACPTQEVAVHVALY